MPKTLKPKPKRGKRAAQLPEERVVSVVGTKRWKETVPPYLQKPLAKALAFMEANDLAQALWWFGDCMQQIPNVPGWELQAKPVLYFGGQVAAQGYFSLKGRDPFHPDLEQWKTVAQSLVTAASEAAPDDPVACHNAGRFFQDAGDDIMAMRYYKHTCLLDDGQVETWGNLGQLYYQNGDVANAWEAWEKCISLPAELASGRLSQAYIWLRKGEYTKGWAAFNDRWKDIVFQREYGRTNQFGPRHWLGGDLPKTAKLLLHGEQGLGDHIQFARYVSVLKGRGFNVVGLETRAPLKRWMEASFPGVPIFARDLDPLPDFTHHCSTMDLPGILGTTMDTVPPPVGTFDFSGLRMLRDSLMRDFSNELRSLDHPLARPRRVGIAWEGAKGNMADGQRSIPPELLRHLADIPGVQWVNLQFAAHGPMTAKAWLNAVDGTEGCHDFLDTAAVMRGLDLIITVDTATAHAAGTLGVPTWVLHRYCREWRWGDISVTGETCPWYPSIRSLTQSAPGDWTELLLRIRTELETMTHA